MKILRGNDTVVYDGEVTGRNVRNALNVDLIEVTIESGKSYDFQKNDRLVFKDKTYYLDETSLIATKINDYSFEYSFILQLSTYKSTEVAFIHEGASVFNIDSNLDNLVDLLVLNLNRNDTGWVKGTVKDTDIENFEFVNQNCASVLVTLSSKFDVQISIENKVISLFNPDKIPTPLTSYVRITRNVGDGQKIYNKIYATGGSENLHVGYPYQVLTLPPIINQSSINKYGVVEGFYSNEDIIPTTESQIVSVNTGSSWLYNVDIPYVIADLIQNNTKPVINFTSGDLSGYSFYFTPSTFNNKTDTVKLEEVSHNGINYPNNDTKAKSGDRFNITNIQQPIQVHNMAIDRLRQEATEHLNKVKDFNSQIKVELDPFAKFNLGFNDTVLINNNDLNIHGTYEIQSIIENINSPNNTEIELKFISRRFLSILNNRISRLVNNDSLVFEAVEGVTNIENNELPSIRQSVISAWDRGDSAFLKAENIELVELPPIRQEASSALTLAGTADGNATSALSGVNTLTPKVETLETELPLVDGKASSALTLAGTADGNATSALSGVNTLTPKVTTLEADIVNKATITALTETDNKATDALADVTILKPKVTTLEADIVNKATIASVTAVDGKVSDNTTAIGTINVELPKKATILALTDTDTKASNALSGVNTLTPKVTTLETDLPLVKTTADNAMNGVTNIENNELPSIVTDVGTANTNATNALSEVNTLSPKVTTLETELPLVDGKASSALTLAGTADGNATSALSGVNNLTPKVTTLETELPLVDGKASSALTLAGTADGNATSALSGVNNLTPKVATLEADIVKKATIIALTDVDNKIPPIENNLDMVDKRTDFIINDNLGSVGMMSEISFKEAISIEGGISTNGVKGISISIDLKNVNNLIYENGILIGSN